MSYTAFIQNNFTDLTQLYITERKRLGHGVLLLDFTHQDTMKIDVSYHPMETVPSQIVEQIIEKSKNPLYDCTVYFCILSKEKECILIDVNMDPARNDAILQLNETKDQEQSKDE